MASLLRFLGNLLLACVIIVVAAAIVLVAYGALVPQIREQYGLDYQATNTRWLWLDRQPIAYRTWGPETGDAYVLVHGYQVEGSETWQGLGDVLGRAGQRAIAIDLPGFGRSVRFTSEHYSVRQQATTLGRALNEMGVLHATVVTHGWGAAVAVQLASEQPQFVRRLVLVAPAWPGERPRYVQRAIDLPYVGRALVWAEQAGGPVWRWRQRHAFSSPAAIPGDYWKRITAPLSIEGTTDALLAMARSPRDDDLPEAYTRLTAPGLIVVGGDDPVASERRAQSLAKVMRSATTIQVVPDAGYYVHIEQPAKVAQTILRWAGGGAP